MKIKSLYCPDCLKDNQVACPRDPDAICKHCGISFCAHHIIEHLRKEHCVSVNWRGFLKMEAKGR